jgi:hypothetical protein
MKLKISCAVCHGDMGRGHATFTAESSHTFHLRCVNHRTACPLCHTSWRDVPGVTPTHALLFDDDEPLEMPPPHGNNQATTAAGGGVMVLKTHCQYPAIAKDATRDGFAVLVHAKAPALALEAAKAPRGISSNARRARRPHGRPCRGRWGARLQAPSKPRRAEAMWPRRAEARWPRRRAPPPMLARGEREGKKEERAGEVTCGRRRLCRRRRGCVGGVGASVALLCASRG